MKTLILLALIAVVLASGATEAADKAIFEFLGLTERPFLKWLFTGYTLIAVWWLLS
jgi:hypothetical protein